MIENILSNVFKGMSEEMREIIDKMIKRKNTYFFECKRYIVDYEYKDIGDNYHLTVASTLMSNS